MKQFLKFTFASALGMVLAIVLSVVIIIAIISAAASPKDEATYVDDNSVLHITLGDPIKDKAAANPLDNLDLATLKIEKQLALKDILSTIEKAQNDDRIKGVYLDLSYVAAGMASMEEIREALENFKTSGKWIISYSEVYTQGTYYLASVADKIYLNPAGIMELRGLSSQLMFFKNALEKLDVEVQIIRHGKFKSAVEPFMLDRMSDSNREQTEKILNSAWGSMLSKISSSRNIEVAKINELADGIKIQNGKDAVKYGFVDELMFKDQLLDELRNKLALEKDEKIQYMSLSKYSKAKLENIDTKVSSNKIAIVYASGEITSGESTKDQMGSETISKAIREARLDDKIKAIVLRINSPGGSALASDIMWREVVLAKEAKPVIVSMGDVAASGGYYMACAADKIVASEKTITGSIGVFGIIPNAKGLFNNKLGITFDTVKTNTHADMLTVFRPLTAEEKDIIQIGVENIYDDFITKVGEGRGMTKEAVDSIGQGRVWLGVDAKEIGLVDEIGGLDKAIEMAKEMAELDDYRTVDYPKVKSSPFNDILLGLSDEMRAKVIQEHLGENYKYYKKVQSLTTQSGIMARMPYEIEVH